MAVIYDDHLKERLKERRIPEAWPREIIEQPEERYRDTLTGVYVAVAKRWYKGREREIAVSYVEQDQGYKAITIHPIRSEQKRNRVDRGRWVKV